MSSTRSLTLLTALLIPLTTAQSDYYAYFGPGPGNATDRTPNGNASDSFNLWYQDISLDVPRWTFRVNVTEIASPEGTSDLSNATQVQTTYGFEWNNTGTQWPNTFEGQLAASQNATGLSLNETAFCVTVLQSSFSANITNHYKSSLDPYDPCGFNSATCYNAILKEFQEHAGDAENGCGGTEVNISKIDECEVSFESYEGVTYNLANMSLESGDTFFHRGSEAYEGGSGNSTALEAELERVHVVILDSGSEFNILCARIGNETLNYTSPGVENRGVSTSVGSVCLVSFVALFVGFGML